jgi:hypothetical protein
VAHLKHLFDEGRYLMNEPFCPGEAIARLPGGLAPRSLPIYRVLVLLVGAAIAIGDTANPVLSARHAVALEVLGFPMFHIEEISGFPLKRFLGDNHSLDVCMGLNALTWSGIEHLLLPSPLTGAMHWLDVGAEACWPGRGIIELYRFARE